MAAVKDANVESIGLPFERVSAYTIVQEVSLTVKAGIVYKRGSYVTI